MKYLSFWLFALLSVSLLAGCESTATATPMTPATATPILTVTPTSSATLTEKWWKFSSPFCPQAQCLGLAEFGQLTTDGTILGGLIVAYHTYPEWREFAKGMVRKQTRIVAGPTGQYGAFYDPNSNIITVHPSLLSEPTSVLVSVLAHEIVHTNQRHDSSDAALCLENEMSAYAWEASMYQRVRQGYERSGWSYSEERLVEAWTNNRLRDYVLLSPIYQMQCFGKALPNY